MKHLMLDLETMGTKADAPIVSAGLCWFDLEPGGGSVGASTLFRMSLETAMGTGRKLDGSTVEWWLQQSEPARMALLTGGEECLSVHQFCMCIKEWCTFPGDSDKGVDLGRVGLWSKGPTFDVLLLKGLFEEVSVEWPFKFWNEFDVRTALLAGRDFRMPGLARLGTPDVAHDAQKDAEHQAAQVVEVWKGLRTR